MLEYQHMADNQPQDSNNIAQQLQGERNLARRRESGPDALGDVRQGPPNRGGKARAGAKGGAPKSPEGAPRQDKNYPQPISTMKFMGFILVAMGQDALQLGLDLIGIGWLAGYVTMPLVIGLYIYFIVRNAPRTMRSKLIMRSGLFTSFEIVPVVGEIVPGWTGVAIMAYRMIKRYESGKGDSMLGKLTDKAIDKTLQAVAPEAAAVKKVAEAVEKKVTAA